MALSTTTEATLSEATITDAAARPRSCAQPRAEGRARHEGTVGVLLVHGFAGTPAEFDPLAAHLAAQGYIVVAPLLAGHGGGPDALAATTWQDWVGSAQRPLDTLRARCQTVVLVGFSMGAAITLYLAGRSAGRAGRPGDDGCIAGLVALSALTRIHSPLAILLPLAPLVRHEVPYVYPLRGRGIDLSDPRVLTRLRDYIPDLDVDPARPEQIAALRRRLTVSVAVYHLHVLLRRMRALLPHVTLPALLIQAAHDEQVAPGDVYTIHRTIRSPDKEVVRLVRSGHMLLAGPECDEVIARVAAFVDCVGHHR